MTPEAFLELACELALDKHDRLVNDVQFHPILQERGLSDDEIESLTATLAASGHIEGRPLGGGYFEISKPVFVRFVLRTLPASTVNKALELCKAWCQPGGGDATAERLAKELNLPEFEAVMLFHHCMSRLGK
jgi:hypothetical protein